MDTLINFDRDLFLLINGLYSDVTDFAMWWISKKITWIPLYVFLAWFLFKKFGKQGIYLILFSVVLITLSDQGSVFIKNTVMRLRPCHDDSLAFLVHSVNGKCGGQFGFVSSHAANVMALFTYIVIITRNKYPYLTRMMMAFVMLVSYSRIYLGVHFPADIVGGWLVGILSAIITLGIYFIFLGIPHEVKKE
jgi:undecaprenyl-diphosphatase